MRYNSGGFGPAPPAVFGFVLLANERELNSGACHHSDSPGDLLTDCIDAAVATPSKPGDSRPSRRAGNEGSIPLGAIHS